MIQNLTVYFEFYGPLDFNDSADRRSDYRLFYE
jgi:hypothetical protein